MFQTSRECMMVEQLVQRPSERSSTVTARNAKQGKIRASRDANVERVEKLPEFIR